MKKLQQEVNLRKDRQSSLFTLTIILLFGLVSVARVIVANRLVDISSRLHKLEVREDQLLAENEKFVYQIENSLSLTSLSDKAQDLGFVPPAKVIYFP